ncbi:MAG TPA: helix-turn-helix domain-containing protein, partial [Thermoanaerobaculia bacterium]
LILQSLELANGVQKRAAELLQVKPSTLNEMMKRLGIQWRGASQSSSAAASASSAAILEP